MATRKFRVLKNPDKYCWGRNCVCQQQNTFNHNSYRFGNFVKSNNNQKGQMYVVTANLLHLFAKYTSSSTFLLCRQTPQPLEKQLLPIKTVTISSMSLLCRPVFEFSIYVTLSTQDMSLEAATRSSHDNESRKVQALKQLCYLLNLIMKMLTVQCFSRCQSRLC